MFSAHQLTYITVEEYLTMEETASVKHEYIDGRVFAMTGANRRHNVIAGNIFTALHLFLGDSSCQVYMEAVKARVEAANCFYYPDVMVACDSYEDDEESAYTEEPVLVVEVLSPSTASTDRREKLVNYMRIPTLREYLIIHQRRRKIEVYRKNEDGSWDVTELGAGEELILGSIPKGRLTIPVDSIYRNVHGRRFTYGSEVREEYDLPEWLSPEEAAAIDW